MLNVHRVQRVLTSAAVALSLSGAVTQATASANGFVPMTMSVPESGSAPAYTGVVMSDRPAAYYRLNDGDATLRDASSNKLNGRYGGDVRHGAAALTSTNDASSAFPGGSFSTARFASASLHSQLQPTSGVTLEAWIRPSAVSTTFIPILTYGKGSQGPAYELEMTPQNVLQVSIKTPSGTINLEGYHNLVPGKIYYASATYDGRTANLYLNGALEVSIAHSGSIYYHDLNDHDGLGIGGALDSKSPAFAGTISEAAIYSKALPISSIVAHYVSGNQPQNLVEHAVSTAAFIDTIGINTHLHYQSTVYTTQWPKIEQFLLNLGVRHIRDGILNTSYADYYTHLETLGKAGIKSTCIAGTDANYQLLTTFPGRVPDAFEAYEPPNEPDLNGGSNWINNTRAFQKMLYTTVKGNKNTARFSVLGPALTNVQDFQALGNLSGYMDDANVHQYFPGFNPGTDGYGSHSAIGIVGSLEWIENVSHITGGSRPTVLSETGFNYAANTKGTVPQDVGAKYLPRLYFETFNTGIRRTFLYQLADFEGESYFQDGLVAQNMTPKPVYYALQSLIHALYDSRPPSQTSTLRYTLRGNMESVHHTLMQRGDGTYDLALWVETRSMVPTLHTAVQTRIAIPAHAVTIVMPNAVRAVAATTINTSGRTVSVPVERSGSTASLDVGDTVSIVHLMI